MNRLNRAHATVAAYRAELSALRAEVDGIEEELAELSVRAPGQFVPHRFRRYAKGTTVAIARAIAKANLGARIRRGDSLFSEMSELEAHERAARDRKRRTTSPTASEMAELKAIFG